MPGLLIFADLFPDWVYKFNVMSRKGKVLVAMSGGIDSTVAALMLHHQGYEVVGITMKTWDYTHSGGSKKEPAVATWMLSMMPAWPP